MFEFYTPDFLPILPQVILIATALAILIEGAFTKAAGPALIRRFSMGALLAILISALLSLIAFGLGKQVTTFNGMLVQDAYTLFCQMIVLVGSAAALAIGLPGLESQKLNRFEYPALILLATTGMMFMISANDLISLFIGLELQGLALYVIVALQRDNLASSEAALKYLVLGALATGMFLYGASFVYGYTGSTNFDSINAVFRYGVEGPISLGVMVGLVFILASLAFKLSAVPFHMWTPDVYQGSPTAVTAFLAAAPKIAAAALTIRLMYLPFGFLVDYWQQIVIFISLASMVLGAFAALRQTDLKRLLAYSSISHMGYALVGIASGSEIGVQGALTYITLYMFMTVGTFAVILALRGRGGRCVKDIEDLQGIAQIHPKMSMMLAIFMFSLAGIPPMAGFFGKLYVFMAAIDAQLYTLSIVGVLSSVVAAFYYLRIIRTMYFETRPETVQATYGDTMVLTAEASFVLVLSVTVTLLFFVYPSLLLNMTQMAVNSLFN